ncbi:Hemolysin-type calcium-binding repeat-containing protein [Nitrosomonas cryotolerans]|uniref:Hemolysin-type calcium-binding repeat-containing protein n=1 Tax=Nitrosomonas cryotolerans ATCC 49181 TaxID=1131553 RepID=A0A1N6ISJ7_9PROT|nr:CAP domain-containing protein [Nitrosomonas cryotolerans]SFP33220.1 Hemolysin-type calcium-binding repeat-containing protein [Nitrosomonas cryotolerans]SIO35002.1 Hemolysin-type calcium-binding repeat-containing protein [Nitrosomonas cryotolerans ATCC 49181]
MSQASTYEQLMLELINVERTKTGAQPLVFNGDLNESSESHSNWMISTDVFSHTGAGGSSPGDRMDAVGYVFTGSWAWAENIAWMSTRAPEGFQDEVQTLHDMLMNSAGHRASLLNDAYREVGIGFETGQFNRSESAFVTQNFARTASDSFLTGVAFKDEDGDKRYDIGEELGHLTISAKNNMTGAIEITTTNLAGGYALELVAGNYTVSFSGNEIITTDLQVGIGNKNVKLDLIDPIIRNDESIPAPQPTSPSNPEPHFNMITGTSRSDVLRGAANNDEIQGLGGRDRLYGSSGNDRLDGGEGNDRLWGGEGADILTGGSGGDVFILDTPFIGAVDTITDFSPISDTILLENTLFTGLHTGGLHASNFHTGAEAHDNSDRIIYHAETGALYFDIDAAGGAEAQQFAQLTPGLILTSADFYII